MRAHARARKPAASKPARSAGARPLADLAADPDNPRDISPEAAAGLGVSVAHFGDLSGIVLDARAGVLVTGHQRLAQLRAAGATTWQVERECGAALTPPDGAGDEGAGYVAHPKTGRHFAVRIVRWSKRTRSAASLMANAPQIAGTFTLAALPQLEALADLPEFAPLRLDALATDLRAAAPADIPPGADDVPEPPTQPVSRTGDLWILGAHRLLCGDSTKREDVARVMAGEKADLLFTDPPYGVQHGRGITKARQIGGDLTQAAIPLGFAVACEALADDAHLYVCGGYENMSMLTGLWDVHLQRQPRILVWVKNGFVLRQHGYHSGYELIFHGWKGKGGAVWYGDRKQSDVWEVARKKETEHSTEKPVELPARAIRNSTPPGAIVLDSFLGSGTTLVAAESLGRRAYGCEREPRYIDIAVLRWQKLTGKQATLDPDGRTFAEVAKERGVPLATAEPAA